MTDIKDGSATSISRERLRVEEREEERGGGIKEKERRDKGKKRLFPGEHKFY